MNEISDLQEGAGDIDPLNGNEDFERRPHPQKRFADHSRTGWGHTYFVRKAGKIKIGHTGSPKQRFASLGIDEILAVVPNRVISEGDAHAKFAHLRVEGEWFWIAPDLLAFIEEIKVGAEKFADKPAPWAGRTPATAAILSSLQSITVRNANAPEINTRISIATNLLSILDAPETAPGHHAACRKGIARAMGELEPLLASAALPKGG